MRNLAKKQNAQKHGVYAATTILPSEDPQEFEELRSKVFAEWCPNGVTEEDACLDIVNAMWAKRRYAKYKTTKIRHLALLQALQPKTVEFTVPKSRLSLAPEGFNAKLDAVTIETNIWGVPLSLLHAENLLREISGFREDLSEEKPKETTEAAIGNLPGLLGTQLLQDVPYEKYASSREWIPKIKEWVDEVLLPYVQQAAQAIEDAAKAVEFFATPAGITTDLDMCERINSKIEKAERRMVQLKTSKAMIGLNKGYKSSKLIEN